MNESPPLASGEWCALHPRTVSLWRIMLLGRSAIAFAVVVLVAYWAWSIEVLDGLVLIAVPAAVAAVLVTIVLAWPPVAYRRWRYRLAGDALEIQRGVVVHRRSSVPYRRVQQVDLTRGPVDRLLGLTAAALTTASATTDGSVPGLAPEVAEEFRRLVLERSGRDDAV